MTDSEGPPEEENRPNPGFRWVFVPYLVVLVSFIVWTAYVVIRQIWAEPVPPRAPDAASAPVTPDCRAGLSTLGGALDRGLRAALWADDEDGAHRLFEAALAPEWSAVDGVERACGADIASRDAFAAMTRQRRVQEGWARRHARDTAETAGGARRFLPVESPPPRHVSR